MIKPTIEEMNTMKLGSDLDSKFVKSVIPINMSIMVPKADNNTYSIIARITWLCKTSYNTLFCLTSNYVAENDKDEQFLIMNPLLEDRYFANYKLASDVLMSSLPHYLTDFNFEFSNPENIHNKASEIMCKALEIKDAEDGSNMDSLIRLYVSPEVFGVLKFIDSYMLNGIYNNADLYSAVVFGPDESNNTTIFVVNRLELLDIAKIKGKHNVVAAKIKLFHDSKYITENTLLIPLSIDTKEKKILNKSRYKKLKDITKDYLTKDGEYIGRYLFNSTISPTEEFDHYFVRATDGNKNGRIFAFDNIVWDQLIDQIKSFK